ncbi:MAG: eight transrane protein EpsH [Gemmatimonadetes bacterium]|nr:eight transrane protein EpsH [Gemmatimonadota bacterium]
MYEDLRNLMTNTVGALREDPRAETIRLLPALVTAVVFALLFSQPFTLLLRDWWTLPEAGHGLLLAPVAIWLAWKAGIRANAAPNVGLGAAILVAAVLLRYMSGLAAELFTMRASMIMALGGLTVYYYGFRQLIHWWMPFLLGSLSIPLPELVTGALALPLQFKASQMGAALLRMREIPVRLTGNVIRIPGNELFVTEACSGLRSLTALISLAVLLGGLVLQKPLFRLLLVVIAVAVAVIINGIRVFFTGFLVYFVDPALGKGFMHITEGWLLFLVSLSCIGLVSWGASAIERRLFVKSAYEPAYSG